MTSLSLEPRLNDNDQAPQFPPYIQFQVSAQNPQIPVQLSPFLQDSGTGSMAGQSAHNFLLADSLQYNFGLMNTPPVVPGCSFDNPASRKDWHQSVGQDLRETMVHKMKHLIFPTPSISTFEGTTLINRVAYTGAATEGDMYGATNSRIEDGEIFASTNQKDGMVVYSTSMFQHLEQQMKKCIFLDEKLKQETMNPKHNQKIIELSYFPLLDFLSTIINLRGLKKGESSVLDYSENLTYILEKLYLKMKIISQFQATVAACDELKESEKSEELEPDPFGYFVPASSSKKNMEVYLTGENIKKTQELVCSLISAFKVIIWLYDEKNGYHLKSSSKSLPKQSEEDLANSSEEENVQSPGEEPVEPPREDSVQSPEEESIQSPGEVPIQLQDQPGPSYQPGPSSAPEYQPGPSSAPEYQPGPSSAPEYQPGPSSAPEYQPGPSSASEYHPGPSSPSEYQPGPSSASEYQPGPSSASEYHPGPSSPSEYQPGPSSASEFEPEPFPEDQLEPFPEEQLEASPEEQLEASLEEQLEASPEYQPESSPEEDSEDTSDSCEVLDETAMEVSDSDDPPKSCSIPEVIPIEDAIITIESSESCNMPEEVQVEQAGCSYSSFQSCSMPKEEPMEEDSSEDSSKSLPQQSEETPEPSPKEPKQLRDGCDFSKVKDLLYKFTKHALRALSVFSDPDIEYCFTEEVLSNEVVAAKNLALMYIIGPRRRIETVFPNILPVIFECLDKSSLVKIFTNNLLGHRRTSDSFSKALLQHFSNISLEVMADDKTSSKQANAIIALFADMLKSFILFPDNIGKYHSACLDKNIKSCIKLIPIAPHPMYFFRVLKILYSAVFRNYEDKLNCCDSLCSMLSHVFQAFDIWLRRPVEHKTWIMILDTVLSISNSVSEKSVRTLLPYIETVCKCITFCIKENAEICLKALHLFERILQIDPINLSILPIKDNLLHVLYTALKRPERKINDTVFTILGKLGSYNRDNFKYAHGLQEAKYSSLCLVLLFENYNADVPNSIEFSLTKFPVDVAYSIITNPDEDIQRKKTCWSFVKEVLKVQMEIAEQSFNNPIVAESENEFCVIHKRALSIMFVAADIDCLSEDAKAFKDKLILTYIIYSCIDQKDVRNHFFLLLLEAAFETIGAILSDNKESVDISPLTSIISPLQMLSYGKIYACPFFEHVVINAVELCYKENWEGKYAGCKTISYILEITDLEWKIYHMWKFINPLLYSFADSNGKLSFGTSKEPIKTLEDMMKYVSECVACSNSDTVGKFFQNLVEALFSCDYCVRKEVRSLLNNLVQTCKINLHDVVRFPFERLREAVWVVRFYEDFEFSNTYRLESYEDDMTGGNKKLYDDLKSLCNDVSDIALPLTPYSIILKDVHVFCGALNALCFNFVNEITINELFGICLNALRSPINEISEDASKCLKYIVTNFHGLEDIIIELVTDWVSNLFQLFISKRDKCVLQEFLYFRQIMPHWPERTLFKMICEIFQIFVNLKAALLMFLCQEEQILDVIDILSEKMYLVIEIMNTLTLWKYKEEGKKSIIREVLSFVADLRPYRKLISVSRLRDPLLKFCRLHHFQALAVELHKKKTSFIFEELINFKNDTYAGSLYYETLLESSKPSEFLKILQYTSKHTPAWFEKKDLTLAKYLLQFHRNRYYAYISSESESSLKTFLFIKESKILVKCLTFIYMYMPEKVDILFELMTVFAFPFASQFQTLKDYVLNTVAKTFTTSFFEKCFLRFTHIFLKKQHQAEAEILEYIIIPAFFYAIRKGNCQHFFVSDNNVSSALSVLDLFYACLWDVTRHTSKTQKAFMKLAVLFAEQIHLMDEKTKKFFILSVNKVLDMLNNFSCNNLLLATLVLNNVCLDDEMKDAVLKDCFDHFMETVHDEEFVLEKFFYMYVTKLPLNSSYQFCERIITHYSVYLDRILNLVSAFKKEFCDVAHIFLRHFMDFEWEWFFQDYHHINKVLKLIDVIMYPGRETIHSEFDDREISWIVNILFQHLSSQKISDKCFSLLKRILEGKIISNQGIYFDSSLTSHLINVAEHPEIYEKCEIFKLMTEVLDYLPLHILELFVNNLHRCFPYYMNNGAEITSSQLKVLEHVSNFLSKLTEKYPPVKNNSESLEELYNNISQLSVSDVTLQKAIVLEAVRPCFYLSTLKEYIATQIGIMFDYYFNEKADILLRIKSLTVWLKILKKEEVFFEISEADKRLLLTTFSPVIDRNLHAEIILEMVSIMDLFVKHLRNKRKISSSLQKKKRRKLTLTFVYEVFTVLGKISSKVDSHFPDDEEINAKLFDVLLVFRESCGNFLQLHDLEDDNFEDLQQSFKGIDERLKSQFKARLLYVPGTLYHSANREKFFKVFAKEIQLDVSGVVRCIFENKFNLTISKSYIALCINLIAMKVKQVLVSPEEKFMEKGYLYESPDLFSSLVQLCFEDAFLAEHIWMHFFPAVLKMLETSGNAKAILDSDDAKAYIKKISSNEYSIVPNPSDVFINGAIKAKPDFCLYADEKSIQRSYSLQVLTSQLLEKHLFQNCSSKTCDDYIKILNEVYSHMEESDLYYCFHQSYAKHKSETKSAMTKMQDINLCKSHELFKNLLMEFMSENSTEFSSSERMFCKNEFIKCSIELTKWNFFSHLTNSMFLRDINIFSKWNIEEGSPTSTLKLQSNFSKCTKIDDSWKDRAVSKCMETLKVFPKFYNRRYYSLLELVQEITELIEAWSVQNNFKFHNMLETSKTIEDVYSKWKERRYLPSDDYQFLTEIFRIRLGFLKYFNSRYSTKGNDLCIDDASRTAFENISIFTKNEINASIIELCTIALFCRNLHIINLKFDKYSNENALNLLQLKTLSLLHDVGPSSNSRFVFVKSDACFLDDFDGLILLITKLNNRSSIEEKIRERVAYISEICLRYLEPNEHEVIDAHMLDILRRFDQEQDWDLGPCKSSNAKLFEMHYEILGKNSNPRENVEEAASLMTCLLASCKNGSILNSMKLMPKILRMLEYEDKDCLFPEVLTSYKIPTQYWLPFLPFLVSRLLKALNPKYENSRMEVDGDTRPSLSYVLLNLLKEIGETYPQEIFFAVNSFKKIDPTIERTGFIIDDGEVELTQWLKSGKEKCEEIIASLKSIYPSLISHLEGFVKDFKIFKPTCHEISLTVVKELLDNVYCSLYENFKDGSTKNCSPEFTSYIRKALELLFALLNSSGEENSFDTSRLFNSVDCCSYASVFGALQALMKRFMHLSSSEKKSFYLDHNQPFITNFHHFEEDIYVFGQSSFVDHCSQVKILKFLPKVETQIFGDHHSYKISVLGHNGKVYSFLLREEHFKEESMKRTKCMEVLKNLNVLLSNNVQCAKRFFNFYFPTMITLDPNMILVPYQQQVLLYQDIMTYKGRARGFSPHLYFTHLLLKDPNAFENADSIVSFIKLAHKEQSAYNLKCWAETLYPDHMDFYSFKKEFIKHLSMLIASEYFLNIAMKNELLVFKKNGIISVFEPRLNLKDMQNFSFMITPNICEFVGPLGLKLIAENVYWIASCFKENMKVIDAYLNLLTRDYYLDKDTRLYDSHEPILKKLDGLNRKDISKFIELSASTVTSCRLNPMIQPFF